jgi:hypothetical protein
VAIVAHVGLGTSRTLAIINTNPLTQGPPLCGPFYWVFTSSKFIAYNRIRRRASRRILKVERPHN